MEFLNAYGLFLAEVITLLLALFVALMMIAGMRQQRRSEPAGQLQVKHLNDALEQITKSLQQAMLSDEAQKAAVKAEKKAAKAKIKAEKRALKSEAKAVAEPRAANESTNPGKIFVLNFEGDVEASGVDSLREEITAILSVAEATDEVVVRLESPGGVVHGYGLAASQLKRITDHGISLTVAVDKVAASGGYMMACIADTIIAAPFAVLGSIGVVAQMPNFHRFLQKQSVDVELHTAGEHKRTLTLFGENTDEGRAKFKSELEDVHQLFKAFVSENRPSVEIDQVSTGEAWYGSRALEMGLIDRIQTSDEYLVESMKDRAAYAISYDVPESRVEKLIKRFAQLSGRLPGERDCLRVTICKRGVLTLWTANPGAMKGRVANQI